MSSPYEAAVQRLIDSFGRLPGIGPKSAQRIAFHILKTSQKDVLELTQSIEYAKENVHFCEICFNLSQETRCAICQNPSRDQSVICVVEEPKDMVAIERTLEYKGLYHILQGTISPIDGIGPDQLRIKELLKRLNSQLNLEGDIDLISEVDEVIVATNPTVEGDATGMYIAKLLEPFGVKVTKLASGLPVGGDLEYADEITLARALEGRLAYS
ncbi:MAG: recombination mediator RecR [Acidimicrobiia bacterium]